MSETPTREPARDVHELIKQAIEFGEAPVECEVCGMIWRLPDVVMNKKIPKEEVGGLRGVIDVGIFCPKCQKFYHSFYNTPRLEAMRKQMDKAQALYMAAYNGQAPLSEGQRVMFMRTQMREYRRMRRLMMRTHGQIQALIQRKLNAHQS